MTLKSKGVDRYLEVGEGGGGRTCECSDAPMIDFRERLKSFFPRKEVKGVGRPYPVLNSVNSTLCWILICPQFIYLFICTKKRIGGPWASPPPPFCCIVRVQTLENHRTRMQPPPLLFTIICCVTWVYDFYPQWTRVHLLGPSRRFVFHDFCTFVIIGREIMRALEGLWSKNFLLPKQS